MKPKACVLLADGINCDQELFYAFEKYGGAPQFVHVNELRSKSKKLKNYQILAIPGGFAYGDDVVSGKILATELVSFLKDQIKEFVQRKRLVVGICNGFQVLVRTGLLPFNHLGKMDATLAQNASGHFECRFVKIKIEDSRAVFLKPYVGQIIDIAVNHGEGRFFALDKELKKVENSKLVFCRYVDEKGKPAKHYPQNPNGALNAIAGITDPTGHILGLMPHPEKIVELTQHPNWRRGNVQAKGGFVFQGMIKFAKVS
ncbi:phosphoribosylformylglycinamidine synthase I [Candidatus Curtissbacteria bacterium]|nr:phosphoribosylformylglycinamidine synthase I [Candidatus Curtissbacteria bacterium]